MTAADAGIAHWLPGMIQMADTLYPTGSYAHSFGLEGLVQEGTIPDLEHLRHWLLAIALPQFACTDLPVAWAAWEALAEGAGADGLGELCHLGTAVKGTRETRAASEAIGRQRLELAARLHGGIAADFLARAEREAWTCPAAVIAAVEARTLAVPAEAMLAALVYAAASAFLAAAVKLLRLGQNACQALLAEALALVPGLIVRARSLSRDEIGAFNPWWDLAASNHESAEGRLFIS